MTFKTVRRGETIEPLDDNHRTFRSKKEFWLGPFALLRPRDCFYFDHKSRWVDHEGQWQEGRVVVMPCGYSEIDDVELARSLESLQKLLDDAWIEEITPEGKVVTRPSRYERLAHEDQPVRTSRWKWILDLLR